MAILNVQKINIYIYMYIYIYVYIFFKIRPHRRCWGVIFRMALVKGYRFTWGGGAFFAQNRLFLIGRRARHKKHCKKQYGRHLFVNAPVQNRKAKSEKKKRVFSTF